MRCKGIAKAHKLRRKVCGLAQKVGRPREVHKRRCPVRRFGRGEPLAQPEPSMARMDEVPIEDEP